VEGDGGRLDALAAQAKADDGARARLVEELLPWLRRQARRYAGGGVGTDDLEQEAVVGALRALERYDPARGTPFRAWARVWVRHALQVAVAEQSRAVRLPTHVLWDLHEVKEARERLAREHRRDPRLQELADALGWSIDRLGEVLRAEAPGEGIEELALVAHPTQHDAYEDVVDRLAARQVAPLLRRLSEREREVLDLRLADESLRQVGRRLGVSQERVRQIEDRALGKLRVAARVDAVRSSP
jgi:RNA polymerase sigma factor (sigma-70 family)